jgi:hypothetical protein
MSQNRSVMSAKKCKVERERLEEGPFDANDAPKHVSLEQAVKDCLESSSPKSRNLEQLGPWVYFSFPRGSLNILLFGKSVNASPVLLASELELLASTLKDDIDNIVDSFDPRWSKNLDGSSPCCQFSYSDAIFSHVVRFLEVSYPCLLLKHVLAMSKAISLNAMGLKVSGSSWY